MKISKKLNGLIKVNLVITGLLLFYSCATSMSPANVYNTLPTLTSSKLISQKDAQEAVRNNECYYLVRGRNYVAPVGLTLKSDLRNGAQGIDEWVQIDGGNAYVLKNYQWITIDHDGTSELYLEFDTMLCE